MTHFFFWGSLGAYFLAMIVLNLTTFFARAGSDYYWLLFRVMGTGRFWLTVLLTTIIALFLPFTFVSFTTLRGQAGATESTIATQSKFNSIANGKHRGDSREFSDSKEPLKVSW